MHSLLLRVKNEQVLSLAKESAEELATLAAEEVRATGCFSWVLFNFLFHSNGVCILQKVSGLRNRLEEDSERRAVWLGSAALSGV